MLLTGPTARLPALLVAVLVLCAPAGGGAASEPGKEGGRALRPGDTLGPENWQLAKELLPPEILKHYREGEYVSTIYEWPDELNRWSEEFTRATDANRGRYKLSPEGTILEAKTGEQAPHIYGRPFPDIDPADPEAGTKILWDYFYTYWNNGNNRNLIDLVWVNRSGVERSARIEARILIYEGQPPALAPKRNPDDLYLQTLATVTNPADLQGTTSLAWRYRDPEKRDSTWTYVPALRRTRAVSPANRSDGFLGSDMTQDDGPFFDGKPQDFTWKLAGERKALRLVDPYRLKGKARFAALPGGGWRSFFEDVPMVGFDDPEFKGIPWAPRTFGLAVRTFWIVEAVPKDDYYLYGKIQLYIDKQTYQGAWNRKFDRKGALLNIYQMPGGPPRTPDGTLYFDAGPGGALVYTCAENVKLRRATVTVRPRGVADPPNDRAISLQPELFNYQNLARFGK